MFDEQGSPRMYTNILMSTDGSDVARKGVKHGLALAKALNAKATVITVTEPLTTFPAFFARHSVSGIRGVIHPNYRRVMAEEARLAFGWLPLRRIRTGAPLRRVCGA